MKIDFLKIKPGFTPPKKGRESFDHYVSSFESLIKKMVPEDLFETEAAPPHFLTYSAYFQKISESLPLITWTSIEEAPSTLSIAVLCEAELTHGLGRFFSDTIARNLIPGKQIPITALRSLNFRFIIHPKQRYFITELYIDIENERDLHLMNQNLPKISEEIRLSLLATQHARKLVLAKPLSLDEKRMILLENLSSLMKLPEDQFDHGIFEDTHHLILKVTKQEKPNQIPDQLLPLIHEKPQAFDPNIFQDIQSLMVMFGETIVSKRDVHHLYRSLAYLYLFRKIMNHSLNAQPNEQFVSLKILRTTLKEGEKNLPILAILICVNSAKENEILDLNGLKTAIEDELRQSHVLKNSIRKSQKDRERISTLYLEVMRDDKQLFSFEEIKRLKRNLPSQIRMLMRPTLTSNFDDLSEEEVIRSILTLSKQLKTKQDVPAVIILFSQETSQAMSFTVILVTLQRSRNPHLNFSEKTHLKIISHQTKIAGVFNKRFLQTAHIFKIEVSKDAASNLYDMRKLILEHLEEGFGPIQDFNSGMIVKQYENLLKLKNLLPNLSSSLIEKYFYSLTPASMQSLLPVKTLKEHFLMLIKSIDDPLSEKPYHFLKKSTGEKLLLMISTRSEELVFKLRETSTSLTNSSTELTTSSLYMKDRFTFGLILSSLHPHSQEEFSNKLEELILSKSAEEPILSR